MNEQEQLLIEIESMDRLNKIYNSVELVDFQEFLVRRLDRDTPIFDNFYNSAIQMLIELDDSKIGVQVTVTCTNEKEFNTVMISFDIILSIRYQSPDVFQITTDSTISIDDYFYPLESKEEGFTIDDDIVECMKDHICTDVVNLIISYAERNTSMFSKKVPLLKRSIGWFGIKAKKISRPVKVDCIMLKDHDILRDYPYFFTTDTHHVRYMNGFMRVFPK